MTARKPWDVESEIAQPIWMYRQEPAKRTSTLESDVWVPLLQAFFVALAWAVLAAVLVTLAVRLARWPWWAAPLALAVTWAVVFPWQVTVCIQERRELLWKQEEIEHRDLDGDGHVGRPEPVTLQVEVVRQSEYGQQLTIVDFGVSPEKAVVLARGILAGRPFSEAEWTGRGKPFSRREFRALRSELLERGLLEWRNPRAPSQGVELTSVGRAVFARLAEGHID